MKLITGFMMTIIMMYTTFSVMEIDCRRNMPTLSIHRSVAVSTEVWISSCAVVEEDVPVCQDPEETEDILYFTRTRRTPYPETGFGGGIVVKKDRMPDELWSVKEDRGLADSDIRTLKRAWWNFFSVPKRKRPERPDQGTAPMTTVLTDDGESRPETIITYSLRGCSPTIVPFNLTPCSTRDASLPSSVQAADAEELIITVTSTRVIYYVPPSTDQWQQSDFSYH